MPTNLEGSYGKVDGTLLTLLKLRECSSGELGIAPRTPFPHQCTSTSESRRRDLECVQWIIPRQLLPSQTCCSRGAQVIHPRVACDLRLHSATKLLPSVLCQATSGPRDGDDCILLVVAGLVPPTSRLYTQAANLDWEGYCHQDHCQARMLLSGVAGEDSTPYQGSLSTLLEYFFIVPDLASWRPG